jgi:predicted TIM-barrel fold metal-dependent hydrolase
LNDFGEIVGTSNATAILWNAAGRTNLGFGTAYDINNNGQIVGGQNLGALGVKGVIWVGGVSTILGTLPGSSDSVAFAIDNAGQIAGVSEVSSGQRATLWDPTGSPTDLWATGGRNTANAINEFPAYGEEPVPMKATVTAVSIIDTHAHIMRNRRANAGRIAPGAIAIMNAQNVELTILSPPPFPEGHRGLYGRRELIPLVEEYPSRFAWVAGGESLNGLIHATAANDVTEALLHTFEAEAEAIARAGALGFGEIAIEHLSSGRGGHPYESVPADHPLLLALVDVAARLGLPVDIHMEAVPEDMPSPRDAPPNPQRLPANIAAFERLLDHNRQATVIWAHAGWDLTLERTVPLMRSLLARHPNLFMSVKVDPAGPQRTSPFGPDGSLRPGWRKMLSDFPDRFMIGSDQFYDEGDSRVVAARRFVDALPSGLAEAIARGNARRIYRLDARR